MRASINHLLSLIKLSWFEAAIKEEDWRLPSQINIMWARRKGCVTASLWVLLMRQGIGSLPQMQQSQFVSKLLPIQWMSWLRDMLRTSFIMRAMIPCTHGWWDWSSSRSSSCGCLPAGEEGRGISAISALPGVEHNHYLRHGVAMTPEIILETIFCEMPLKCKIQCLLSAGAALLSSWGSLANRFTDKHSLNFKS